MKTIRIALFYEIMSCVFGCNMLWAMPSGIEWIYVENTPFTPYHTVSADSFGSVYVSGSTKSDAILKKFDTQGHMLWEKLFGTYRAEYAYGVSADGLGNVYVSGDTSGSLAASNAGSTDAFLSKYNQYGDLLWSQQIGTTKDDLGTLVSADRLGNVYISGYTYGDLGEVNAGVSDAFLVKFDGAGNKLWTRQFGTGMFDSSDELSVDGLGNVYVTGSAGGSLDGSQSGGAGAYLSKFDADGNVLWIRQFDGASIGVSVDGHGNAYIAGFTDGNLGGPNVGKYDAFVGKYDRNGNLLWLRQLGSEQDDFAIRAAPDNLGNVFITGATFGDLGGSASIMGDTFVSKYDSYGNYLWTQRLNLDEGSGSFGASADGLGNVYVSGLSGYRSRGFLAKLHDPLLVPEPSALCGAYLFACLCLIIPSRLTCTVETK